MTRPTLAREIVDLIGPSAALRDVGTGWPSRVLIRTEDGTRRVALHVSRVSPHAREPWEWRFQNPASRDPVSAPGGSLPLLVGLDQIDGRQILIAVDGTSRLGREARFSILFNKRVSREAAALGWSEQITATGERIFALWPRLLPLLIEVLRAGVDVPVRPIVDAAEAAGIFEENTEQASERARRTVSAYVRDAKFSQLVREAYQHRCAMCRIGLRLVAGAHILPVCAPGAPDRVWNGISLCHNHHAAFDAHRIWIGSDYSIRLSPLIVEAGQANPESARFLAQTGERIWVPPAASKRPREDMLAQRYTYYEEEYEWASVF